LCRLPTFDWTYEADGVCFAENSWNGTLVARVQKVDAGEDRIACARQRQRSSVFAMFHLDYLSCALTVPATILLARKSWIGLLIATVNSFIVCAIALRTSQLGLIPANLICICIYASSMRSWLCEQTRTNRGQAARQDTVAAGLRTSPAGQRHAAPLGRFICVILHRQGHGFTCLNTTQFHEYCAADLSGKRAAFMARSHVLDAGDICKAVVATPVPQQIEPSTLNPSLELNPDRTCLPGLG
jgi:hypothetical protein